MSDKNVVLRTTVAGQELYAKVAEYDSEGNKISTSLESKQDVISDIAEIRSGAAAGATAYQKPNTGIPSSDMTSEVQTSLGLADSAVQPADISGKEDISNKVTSVRDTSTATNTAYTSEKAVATALATKQGNLEFDGTYDPSTNKVATESTVADAISGLSRCTVTYTTGTGELHLDFRPANS